METNNREQKRKKAIEATEKIRNTFREPLLMEVQELYECIEDVGVGHYTFTDISDLDDFSDWLERFERLNDGYFERQLEKLSNYANVTNQANWLLEIVFSNCDNEAD